MCLRKAQQRAFSDIIIDLCMVLLIVNSASYNVLSHFLRVLLTLADMDIIKRFTTSPRPFSLDIPIEINTCSISIFNINNQYSDRKNVLK